MKESNWGAAMLARMFGIVGGGVLLSVAAYAKLEAASVETVELNLKIESPVLATQGDAVVTLADFESFLERVPEAERGFFLDSRRRVGELLENLMLPRLLVGEARQEGLLEKDAALQARIWQAAAVLIGDEMLLLASEGQALEDYTALARELYLTEAYHFAAPDRASFTHVLIQPGVERGELGAMRLVLQLYESLREGADLTELAIEHSDDPAVSDNQGSYEGIALEELDRAVATALALMEPGQISEPVRSAFGWHLLRLDERIPGEPKSWEDAEALAIEMARERHMVRMRERLIQRLRADPMIVEKDVVQSVLDRFPEVRWRAAELD